ncbi:protein kinase-like protein [Actinophytocola oryzae]|uniref:non-specific serine/threonine protein kinase n=2 Tax=Actinophytocola oryzae TaxID=502181 RepID=A0A4R7VZ77_9PSEU|nr:protein kinase-like protein [Actinophytocola oryzae]
MADVYEAWDLRLQRAVAIKRYRAFPSGTGMQRFISEAELLGSLSHPGLLTVFDVSLDGERPFLVLSLARGGTLRDRLDIGPLGPSRVAEIGVSVAQVVEYIHARDIVHRDLKPSNMLFDEEDDCYLADFGIAKALGAANITDSKEFVGTAGYLAPEQVEGRHPGPPVDVYALGLVLLECLTGHPEYTGTDVEMALARLARPPYVPDTWGPNWQAVLTAMTATDPEKRPDAGQCVNLLRALQAGQTVPMVSPVLARSRRVFAGVAAAATVVIGTLVFTVGQLQLFEEPVVDPVKIESTATPSQKSTSDTPSPEPTRETREGSVPPEEVDPVDHDGAPAETPKDAVSPDLSPGRGPGDDQGRGKAGGPGRAKLGGPGPAAGPGSG